MRYQQLCWDKVAENFVKRPLDFFAIFAQGSRKASDP